MSVALLPATVAAEVQPRAEVRFTSDYVYRGYSKSDGGPAVQSRFSLHDSGGAFAGVWFNQVDFGGANLEFMPYAGYARQLGPDFNLELSASGYLYDHAMRGRSADYAQTALSVNWRQLVTVRASADYDAYGSGVTTGNLDSSFRWPLTDVVDLIGGVGYDCVALATDYDVLYWHAGARVYLGRHVALELRYTDLEWPREVLHSASPGRFDSLESNGRVVFSVAVGF